MPSTSNDPQEEMPPFGSDNLIGLPVNVIDSLCRDYHKFLTMPVGTSRALYGGGYFDFEKLLTITDADRSVIVDRAFGSEECPDWGTPFLPLKLAHFEKALLEVKTGGVANDWNLYQVPFRHLKNLGVLPEDITLREPPCGSGSVEFEFKWKHPLSQKDAIRSIILKNGPIEDLSPSHPAFENGLNFYLQIGSECIPSKYHLFLPLVANSLCPGGYLITDDHYMGSEKKFDPSALLMSRGVNMREMALTSAINSAIQAVSDRGEQNCLTLSIRRRLS
jgi:hypothetical protein